MSLPHSRAVYIAKDTKKSIQLHGVPIFFLYIHKWPASFSIDRKERERELYSLLGRLGQLYVFILGFFTLHENYKEDVTDLQLFKEFSSCCCIFENKTVMKELGNGGILDLRFNLRIFCF